MSTEKNKTNESNKFIYQFTNKLNQKSQITKILIGLFKYLLHVEKH